MNLKIKRKYYESFPSHNNYLVGGKGDDIVYNVSNDFIRDLMLEIDSGRQTNFTTCLIRLIFKAFGDNFDKLSKVYPAECLTIWAYQNISDFHTQFRG